MCKGKILFMKKDPLYKSFGYAFQGIFNTIRTERNIKIHCAAAILVTIFGIWLQISKIIWTAYMSCRRTTGCFPLQNIIWSMKCSEELKKVA